MTLSLRAYAHCIGIDGAFFLLRDFFGYETRPPWSLAPAADSSSLPTALSLRAQLRRLNLKYFNVSVVKVGVEPEGNGFWNDVRAQEIDAALQLTREVYGINAGFGIGRVTRWQLSSDQQSSVVGANSSKIGEFFDGVLDRGSANNLAQGWDAGGDAIELLFVQSYGGSTDVGNTPWGEDGVLVELGRSSFFATARTLAHELGHFLIRGGAVEHDDDPSNLMTQSQGAIAATNLSNLLNSTTVNNSQISDMRTSDWMRLACFQPETEPGTSEISGETP
jgi:hypothetical protein